MRCREYTNINIFMNCWQEKNRAIMRVNCGVAHTKLIMTESQICFKNFKKIYFILWTKCNLHDWLIVSKTNFVYTVKFVKSININIIIWNKFYNIILQLGQGICRKISLLACLSWNSLQMTFLWFCLYNHAKGMLHCWKS